jgi:SAM-dependent methyltransferase
VFEETSKILTLAKMAACLYNKQTFPFLLIFSDIFVLIDYLLYLIAGYYQEARVMFEEIYRSGVYLRANPTWHAEASPLKAAQILQMLKRNSITPTTVCEVGCGAGEILAQLQKQMDASCSFCGYEISPQALMLARERENERLRFKLADFSRENAFFDLILLIDMIEHVENCFSFLRDIKSKGEYKMIQFALDLTVGALLRPNSLLGFRSTHGHVGHVHYFTKNIALATLEDLGYEVIDHFYTPLPPAEKMTLKDRLLRFPRKLLYGIDQDLAVRLIGGYKLLVLAR